MKTIKVSKKITAFVLSLVVLAAAVIVYVPNAFAEETTLSAEDENEINNLREQQNALDDKINAAQNKIDSIADSISDQEEYVSGLTAQIDNYQEKINLLNNSISALENDKAAVQTKIESLNSEIAKVEDDISYNELQTIDTNQKIEDTFDELKERLRDIYMHGSSSEVEMLLSCTDFSSFLMMVQLTSSIAEHDNEMIEDLKKDIAELDELTASYKDMIAELDVKKESLNSEIAVLDSRHQEIEKSKSTLVSSQNEVSSLQSKAMSYLSSLDAQSNAYQSLVNQYEKERNSFDAKIDEIIRNASKQQVADEVQSSDGFIWPLQYSDAYISSPFGYRSDPISGVYKLHAGVDTCCRSGTYGKAVSAAASGVVIISTFSSSYGYYVGINHGNGFVTVYAHNSSLAVSVGQTVTQGQTIAYAGATGYATGAHVHFEIRVNGEKVNALNYVSP